MVFCSSCGAESEDGVKFCSKCGSEVNPSNPRFDTYRPRKERSGLWYLVPILFSLIGGIIAYLVVKDDDPKLAENCLIVGIILFAIGLVFISFAGF